MAKLPKENLTKAKLPRQRFHLVFSFVMGFLVKWTNAFIVAYVIAVPAIYFVAPMARTLTARRVETP
jgi:hypothetical protein